MQRASASSSDSRLLARPPFAVEDAMQRVSASSSDSRLLAARQRPGLAAHAAPGKPGLAAHAAGHETCSRAFSFVGLDTAKSRALYSSFARTVRCAAFFLQHLKAIGGV